MKKITLKLALSLAVVVAAGYTAYTSQARTQKLEGVTLDNVEAIASGESHKGCKLNLLYVCETQNGDHILYRNI